MYGIQSAPMRLGDDLVEGHGSIHGCRSPTDGFDVPEMEHDLHFQDFGIMGRSLTGEAIRY